MTKTVLITGASSGFGKLCAQTFQSKGWNVIATMRDPAAGADLAQLDNVQIASLDVTDGASIARAVREGLARFGKIDVLVNNAGFAQQGVLETTTDAQMRHQFDVCLFGLVDVTKALLPHFRETGDGVIVNLSSIGGRVAFPFTSLYHAVKFAVEGLTESLQYELDPLGIRVKLVEPGAYGTRINQSAIWSGVEDGSAYKDALDKARAAMRAMADQGGQDPQEVADTVYLAATDGTATLRYPVGADAEQILTARARMTDTEFKSMIVQSIGL